MKSEVPQRRRGRPRKDAANLNETREDLLRAGVAALTEKGFSATGLDEILRSVSVPKGSFYHYFDSKETFGLALIEQYANYFAAKLEYTFSDEAYTPLERLHNFVAEAENGMRRYEFKRGCLVGNLGQEMGALPASFRTRLIEVFNDWEAKAAACIRSAQAQGEIRTDVDPDETAEFFWVGWEGAVLRSKLELSPRPLNVFAAGFFRGLEP